MKLSLTLLFPFIFLSFLSAQTTASGDIFSRISTTISNMPGDTGDDYSSPSAAQLNTFNLILNDLINGNYADADLKAATVDYDIIAFTETTITPNPTYYIIEKTTAGSNYWGTYIYNPNPCRPGIVIQSPHSKKDFNTGKQGIHIFRKIEAEFFFLNGTSRCNHSSYSSCSGTTSSCGSSESFRISDLAHVDDAVFYGLTTYIFDNYTNPYFVQLHGFTKQATDPYVILSNGTTKNPTVDPLPDLKNYLFNTDHSLTFKIGHIDNWTRLIGTTNTQGRYINSSTNICTSSATSASGRFLHLEQERTKLRNEISGWDKMANGLAHTFMGVNCLFLPLELISFDVKEIEDFVQLQWETAYEENVFNFEIEHSSDGKTFNKIGAILATNNGNYNFKDPTPRSGKQYYRIKINDYNHIYNYSPIINLDLKNIEYTFIYPNPSTDKIHIKSSNKINNITIHDLTHRLFYSSEIYLEGGIPIHDFTKGMYILSFTIRGKNYHKLFIKN